MLYCSTIEFKQKRNNISKEQSQLNSKRNYDIVHFCFDRDIRKRVFEEYKITNKFNTILSHDII